MTDKKIVDGKAPQVMEESELEEATHSGVFDYEYQGGTVFELGQIETEFSEKYPNLDTGDKIAKLEKLLTEGSELIDVLSDNEKLRLGFYTSLYFKTITPQNHQQLRELENLDFLKKFGLEDAKYVLAGLSDTVIKNIKTKGDNCLYKSSNVLVEKVESAGEHFASSSSRMLIRELNEVGDHGGYQSFDMRIELLDGNCHYFGKLSHGMIIDRIESVGNNFGEESRKTKIRYIKETGDNFGKKSKHMQIEEVFLAGKFFGKESEYMEIGIIEKVQIGLGENSTRMKIRELNGVDNQDYLANSSGALILKIDCVYAPHDTARNYIYQDINGKFYSDRGLNGLEALEKTFGVKLYEETRSLLIKKK